jgi:hypothetical protein
MGSSKLRRPAELNPVEVHQLKSSATSEQRLVSLGQREISSPIRYDEHFEQRHRRRDELALSSGGLFEKGTQERKEPRVLLDIVDENSGIYGDAARAERA